jgi:hypothetical protein
MTPSSALGKSRRSRQKDQNRKGGPRIASSTETPLLELQTQLWRARAQAKQKWLERTLAEATKSSDEAAWRMTWIKRALKTVKREQAEIKYHAALMDAYAEHLSVLEMTLMGASEQKPDTASSRAERRE